MDRDNSSSRAIGAIRPLSFDEVREKTGFTENPEARAGGKPMSDAQIRWEKARRLAGASDLDVNKKRPN